MKFKLFAMLLAVAAAITACTDTTDTIGSSLTNQADQFDIQTDTFNVNSRSIVADSVLSRGLYSYLGCVKDPETETFVTCSYATQFSIIEELKGGVANIFPDKDSIDCYRESGELKADSCELRIYVKSSVGDSLRPMRLSVEELSKPIEEGKAYYSNFNPEADGYVRSGANAVMSNLTYTKLNLNYSASLRDSMNNGKRMYVITVPLNGQYTDANGKTYDNYGTYLMRSYFDNPSYFANSYTFTHNVCPGVYIKSSGGTGVMSEVAYTDLYVYYKGRNNGTSTELASSFVGTEEVMQTTYIENDKDGLTSLADGTSCTYIKSPAGIFTEVELPIDSIMLHHESDSIGSARVVFTCYNAKDDESGISAPANILMLPKDSLYSFFENRNLPNNKVSYRATLSTQYNTYTFNNISKLITTMYNNKRDGKTTSDNWNKVVLVPITITSTTSTSSTIVTNVTHDLSLASARLVGGPDNKKTPITISVIYNKFKKD